MSENRPVKMFDLDEEESDVDIVFPVEVKPEEQAIAEPEKVEDQPEEDEGKVMSTPKKKVVKK